MPGFELFGEEERKHINDVMDTGIIMRYGFDGPRKGIFKSLELEKKVMEVFGCGYAQLVSSGTAALTTVMAALNIGAGDEVIMPSFTFVASFEAILSVGAIPVMVDIDETLTLSPEAVTAAITPKTKCVMPVHMCGSMADMDALKAICAEHNLILLEDACQAIGGTYKGKHLGTIGDAGTFSFDFVKTITCGEGGVVMTNSKDIHTKCDGYTDHGHDHLGVDRGTDLHPFLGYNFRISELHAAIGLGQIGKLPTILGIQKKNHGILKSYLEQIPEISFRSLPDPEGDSHSFISWFLPTAELAQAVVAEMKAQGILAGNFYWFDNNWHYVRKWQHLQNAVSLNNISEAQKTALLALKDKDFSTSDAIMSRCVSTSIALSWTEEQVHDKGAKMAAAIQKVLEAASVEA
ncbi:DegT/DnrJ/EryC1/StrS family aminotransferase [Parasediminibacterium sp. JCM 36343]|uniref:DegT/DnrJ/EryC1/StrS family aminotransferase n=1 Tax=Parasediminibacterium sp. JCM 36343 TaxID=3374279 RepID=UPI00397CE3A4